MNRAAMRDRRRERWQRRAESARDAFGLVFVLVLITYVLTSLLTNRGWGAVTITIATSVTSVVALTSSHAKPHTVHVAIRLSLLTVLLAVIEAVTTSHIHIFLDVASLIQMALLIVAMASVLGRVVAEPRVGPRAILGALSVYAVLGLLFTYLYGTIDRLQTGNFFEGVAHPSGSDFLFFSYTTLTTTGYGDLVPGGQPGRMFTGLEMMIGQIFLVTLVAGLVSLWRPGEAIRRRRDERAAGDHA